MDPARRAVKSPLKDFFIGKGAQSGCPFHRFNHRVVERIGAAWDRGSRVFHRMDPLLAPAQPKERKADKAIQPVATKPAAFQPISQVAESARTPSATPFSYTDYEAFRQKLDDLKRKTDPLIAARRKKAARQADPAPETRTGMRNEAPRMPERPAAPETQLPQTTPVPLESGASIVVPLQPPIPIQPVHIPLGGPIAVSPAPVKDIHPQEAPARTEYRTSEALLKAQPFGERHTPPSTAEPAAPMRKKPERPKPVRLPELRMLPAMEKIPSRPAVSARKPKEKPSRKEISRREPPVKAEKVSRKPRKGRPPKAGGKKRRLKNRKARMRARAMASRKAERRRSEALRRREIRKRRTKRARLQQSDSARARHKRAHGKAEIRGRLHRRRSKRGERKARMDEEGDTRGRARRRKGKQRHAFPYQSARAH